jgi:adenylosuccinate lyase
MAGMPKRLPRWRNTFLSLRSCVTGCGLSWISRGSFQTGLFRPLSDSETSLLQSIQSNFSTLDAQSIQSYERETRHDVKAIEYYLKNKLQETSLADLLAWLHFGLTSEDVNNIAQAIALRDSRDLVLLPALDQLIVQLREFAIRHRAIPMLARTHGQAAVPTTVGKEFAVYVARLRSTYDEMAAFRLKPS